MRCTYCNHPDSRVIDSRPTEDGTVIRRRRECEGCGRRFTTYEKVERATLLVVKKDGRREAFDADKVRAGVVKSCEKRPVTALQIDDIVRAVEAAAYNSLQQEITTASIGEMVMVRLKELDEVAYVRFASVYKHFADLNAYMEELRTLIATK